MRLPEVIDRVRELIPPTEPITIPEISANGLLAPDEVVDALFLLVDEGSVRASAISTHYGYEVQFRRT